MIENFEQLLQAAKKIGRERTSPMRVVIAAGDDHAALSALAQAKEQQIADGILVGRKSDILNACAELNVPETKFEIVEADTETDIGRQSMRLVREGAADIVMKGKIKTASLFKAVLDAETGLRTKQLISDVFICETHTDADLRLLMITDGGINLAPDLKQKVRHHRKCGNRGARARKYKAQSGGAFGHGDGQSRAAIVG